MLGMEHNGAGGREAPAAAWINRPTPKEVAH